MYGIDSSPKAFYDHVSAHLLALGYHRGTADPCFFWRKEGSEYLFAVVHVDDFAVTATRRSLFQAFVADMKRAYVVTITDSVNHFLGRHITNLSNGDRLLSQPGLLDKLVTKYPQAVLVATLPTVPMSAAFSDEEQDASPRCDTTKFMELLGSLLYLTKTRPDVSYAVHRMAMRAKRATEKDFNSLLRILSYLANTRSAGILLTASASTFDIVLEAWSDAAYACHTTGHSHTGIGFRLANLPSGFFFSKSVKQTTVATSSTEAELYAAVNAVKEVIWVRLLLTEIGFPQLKPTILFVDNKSLITLASDYSGNHKRVKHFMVSLQFLIEKVKEGTVQFEYVHTADNTVDVLTKPLGPTEFHPKAALLLGLPPLE
jgi:hypothetical protein